MLAILLFVFLHLMSNKSKTLEIFIDPDCDPTFELGTSDNPFKTFNSAIKKVAQTESMSFYFRSKGLIFLDSEFKVDDFVSNLTFSTFYNSQEGEPAVLQISDDFFMNAVHVHYFAFSNLTFRTFHKEAKTKGPVFSLFKSKASFFSCDFLLNFSCINDVSQFFTIERGELRFNNCNISIIIDKNSIFSFIGLAMSELYFWRVNFEESFLKNGSFAKDIQNGESVLIIHDSLVFKNNFRENSKAFDNIGTFILTNLTVLENLFIFDSTFIDSRCSIKIFNLIDSNFERNLKENSEGVPMINLERPEAGGNFLMENSTINFNKGNSSSFLRILLFERVVVANIRIENNSQVLDIFYLNRIAYSSLLNIICKGTNNPDANEDPKKLKLEGGCFRLVDVNLKKIIGLSIIENYGFDHTAGLIIEDSIYNLSQKQAKISVFNSTFMLNKVSFQYVSLIGASLYIDSDQILEIHMSKFSFNQLTPSSLEANILARPGGPCIHSVSLKNSLLITNSDFSDNNSKHLCSCIIFQGSFFTVFNASFFRNQPFITIKDKTEHKKVSAFFPSIYDTLISTLGGAISSLSENVLLFACSFIGNKAFRGAVLFANGKDSSSVINIRVVSCLISDSDGSKAVVLYYSNRFSYLYYYLENSIVMRNSATESSLFFGDFGSAGVKIFIANHTFFSNNTGEFNVFSQFEVSFMKVSNSIICFNSAQSNRPNYPSSVIINLVCQQGYSTHIFTNNTYYGNKATSKCGAISVWGCIFSSENEAFYLNSAQNNAGVIFAFDRAIINITNAKFLENSAFLNGGCVFISDNVTMNINGSKFTKCQAGIKGGAIYLREGRSILIENSLFEMSRAFTGSVISGLDNKLIVIKKCSFQKNTAEMELYELKNSLMILNESKINNPGFNLFILGSVTCQLNDVTIFNSSCGSMFSGCVMSASEQSNITIFNSRIELTSSLTLGGVIYLSSSNLTLVKVNISSITSAKDGSCAMAQDKSLLLVIDSLLEKFTKYCFYGSDVDIIVKSSIFKTDPALESSISDYKGSILCSKCNTVEIFSSTFEGGFSNKGGAIQVFSLKNPLILKLSSFIANLAETDGGAVHLYNSDIDVSYCLFKNNSARKTGGAIHLFSEPFAKFKFNITDSKFENNFAGSEGGAVKWLENQPIIENCIFSDNKALYGENVAAFPIRLKLKIFRKNADQNEEQEFDSLSANESVYKNFEKLNFTPGQIFPSKIVFQVVDIYGSTVKSLKDELVDIKLVPLSDNQQYKPYLLGGNTLKIEEGSFSLDGVEIFSSVNSESLLFLSVPSIKRFYSNLLQDESLSPFEIGKEGAYVFKIGIISNSCPNGSVFNSRLIACARCPFNFVSLSPMSQEACVRCPQGAICPGGATIYSKQGYWLPSNQTIRPLECPEKDFCLEGPPGSCKKGHIGPLCLGCNSHSSRNQFGLCVGCDTNPAIIYLQMIGYFLVMNVICTLMIRAAFRNVKKAKTLLNNSVVLVKRKVSNVGGKNSIKEIKERKIEELNRLVEDYAIFYKILLNYFQLMGIVRSLPIKWPDYFQSFYDSYKILNFLSIKFISLGCLVNYDSADLKEVEAGDKIPLVLLEGILVNVFVIFYFLVICLIFYIHSCVDNRGGKIVKKIFISFMILFDMLQPSLVQENVKMFSCIEVEGKYFLQGDVNVSCETSMYSYLTNIFFLFFLSLWTLIIPATIFYFLRKNRENLNNFKIFSVLGSYYIGYHSTYYYWDFTIMFRENFVIFITLVRISDDVKIYFVLLLLFMSLNIQLTSQPLIQARFNKLEELAISVTLITVFTGILYKSGASSLLTIISILLMILLNFFFLFLWVKGFASIIYSKFVAPLIIKSDKFKFLHKHLKKFFSGVMRSKSGSSTSRSWLSYKSKEFQTGTSRATFD